jgi:hypothetical protein
MIFVIQYLSIAIEVVIALIGLAMVLKKKKSYGWAFFFTFLAYAFYDTAKLMAWKISYSLLYILFFMATLSVLWAVISVYLGHSPLAASPKRRKR